MQNNTKDLGDYPCFTVILQSNFPVFCQRLSKWGGLMVFMIKSY